jgi:ubiquinone/menaquinone biosynthesis C-methylase UbiE
MEEHQQDEKSRVKYHAKYNYSGQTASKYLDKRVKDAKWQMEQELIEQLIRQLPSGSVVLDAPVGTGRFLDCYERHNVQVYGLDISRDMLSKAQAIARHGSGCQLIQGDLELLPLPACSVEQVICIRFMNWLPFDILSNILAGLKRVSKKSMIIEIRVTRESSVSALLRNTFIEIIKSPGSSLRRIISSWLGRKKDYFIHNGNQVEKVLSSQGFGIEETHRIVDSTAFTRMFFKFTPLEIFVLRRVDEINCASTNQ